MRQVVNAGRQRYWDLRAAGNFIGGGTGTGLVLASLLGWATGGPVAVPVAVGLCFVGLGLVCVWFEIGRPWRAINVFFHPHTSWMTRESLLAPPLMAAGAATVVIDPAFVLLAGAFAAGYLYCQARMLHASRGIPAWYQKEVPALMLATGLAEGTGLYLVLGQASTAMIMAALIVGCGREAIREAYRRGLVQAKAPAGTLAWLSSGPERGLAAARLVALLLLVLGLAGLPTAAAGGVLAAATGWGLKAMLVTRAAFIRGHVIDLTPARGRGPSRAVVPS